jgi:hypothetical protein
MAINDTPLLNLFSRHKSRANSGGPDVFFYLFGPEDRIILKSPTEFLKDIGYFGVFQLLARAIFGNATLACLFGRIKQLCHKIIQPF